MKKVLASFVLLMAALSLTACSGAGIKSLYAPDCSVVKPVQDTNPLCLGGS